VSEGRPYEAELSGWVAILERWGLVGLTIPFLDVLKVWGFVGAQLLWMATPFFNGPNASSLERLAQVLEEPDTLRHLQQRLRQREAHE
jgi:hypothetical protein